jgi:hypothetical protein
MVAAIPMRLSALLLFMSAMMCSEVILGSARRTDESRLNSSTPQGFTFPTFPGGQCSGRKDPCRKEVVVGRGDDVDPKVDFYTRTISFDICESDCKKSRFIGPYNVDDWTRGLWSKFLCFRGNIELPTHETVADFSTLAHFIDGIWAKEKSTFTLFDDWINSPRNYVDNIKGFMKNGAYSKSLLFDRMAWEPYKHKPWQGKKALIVGAGPVGLRMAIEARLLGADVFVCEARSVWNRGNVMKMWKVAKSDLMSLGMQDDPNMSSLGWRQGGSFAIFLFGQ